MRGVVEGATLRRQFRELGEEPVAILEETIFVDCVKLIPVLIGSAVIFLCKIRISGGKKTNSVKLPTLQVQTNDKYFYKKEIVDMKTSGVNFLIKSTQI